MVTVIRGHSYERIRGSEQASIVGLIGRFNSADLTTFPYSTRLWAACVNRIGSAASGRAENANCRPAKDTSLIVWSLVLVVLGMAGVVLYFHTPGIELPVVLFAGLAGAGGAFMLAYAVWRRR